MTMTLIPSCLINQNTPLVPFISWVTSGFVQIELIKLFLLIRKHPTPIERP